MSVSEQARILSRGLSRYHATGWRFERELTVNPQSPGSERAAFWEILKLKDVPLKTRQIRKILSSQICEVGDNGRH